MKRRVILAALFVCAVTASAAAQGKPTLQGAWRIVERTTTGPAGATNKSPQPSLWIFTARHYSIMSDNGDKPRRLVPAAGPGAAAKLSDADRLVRFEEWAPITANAGTYELNGSTLTLKPIVAKSTAVATSKTGLVYQVKMQGDSLTLTQVVGPAGQKSENPTTLRLQRME